MKIKKQSLRSCGEWALLTARFSCCIANSLTMCHTAELPNFFIIRIRKCKDSESEVSRQKNKTQLSSHSFLLCCSLHSWPQWFLEEQHERSSVFLGSLNAINQPFQLSLNTFSQKKTICAKDEVAKRKEAQSLLQDLVFFMLQGQTFWLWTYSGGGMVLVTDVDRGVMGV